MKSFFIKTNIFICIFKMLLVMFLEYKTIVILPNESRVKY